MVAQTLRFRKARDSADHLGQVFTPIPIARMLASTLSNSTKIIIDVGAGQGALSIAALSQCKGAKAILIEQDGEQVAVLNSAKIRKTRIIHANALEPGLLETHLSNTRNAAILSNPPYGMLRHEAFPRDENAVLHPNRDGAGWVRGDAAFVARIWNSVRLGDHVGLIVASPIICSPAYAEFRREIVKGLNRLIVTELHPKTFPGAEVQAFLITGERAVSRSRNVVLRSAGTDGEILEEMAVSQVAAWHRLDYRYHATITKLGLHGKPIIGTFADLHCTVSRGSRSNGAFRSLGLSAFHTSNFTKSGESVHLTGALEGFTVAQRGDLLIARVGSRCLQREAKVVSGAGLITDCVYRIRTPARLRGSVWGTINSSFGREWRELFAEGSCARYLTVTALNALPILL